MKQKSALFGGDVSIDLTMTCARMPEPDEKVHVDAIVEAPGGVAANAAVAEPMPRPAMIAAPATPAATLLLSFTRVVLPSWCRRLLPTCPTVHPGHLTEPEGRLAPAETGGEPFTDPSADAS